MKKFLQLTFLMMALAITPLMTNAQVTVIFPAGPVTPQADICSNETSAGMAVIFNTATGTTTVTWSILTGPVGTTIGTASTSAGNSINTINAGSVSGSVMVQVEINNPMGGSQTKFFTLDVMPLPGTAVVSNPSGKDVICPGEGGASLSASSTDADTYMWFKDGVEISGATSSTYSATEAGSYTSKGVNDCGLGIISASAITITEGVETTIDTEPVDYELPSGATTASFAVAASGTNLSYVWYMNGSPLADGGDFAGTTTSTLNITANAATYTGNNFACFVHGDCGTATFSAQAVLPIDLVSFDAKMNKEVATLNWVTASEFNNEYFAIERSYDGKEFNTINKIDGAGESNEMLTYSFDDSSVLVQASSNTVYYRLKQVDFDGTSSYSDIISINIARDAGVEITNIIQEASNLDVFISAKSNEELNVSVYDLNGRNIASVMYDATEGYNKVSLDLNSSSNGLFIISVMGQDVKLTKKVFIK